MARVKNDLRNRDFSQPPPDFDEPDDQPLIEPDDLDAFMGNMADGDGEIKVYRAKVGSGSKSGLAWLFSFKPGEYTYDGLLAFLRDGYGGGDYVVRVHAGRGNQLMKVERVTIEAPRETAPPVLNAPDPMAQFYREQAQQNQAMMMSLMTALAGRPAPVAPEGLSIADALALADRIGNKHESPDPLKQLQLMRELRELGLEMSGNAPAEDTGFMGLLKTLAPAIATMSAQQPAPSERPLTQAAPPRQAAPAPQLPRQAEPTPRPPADAVDSEAELRVLIKMLIRAASQGADAVMYADVVIDQIGEENAEAIAGNADVMGALLAQFPEAASFGEWFGNLRQALVEYFAADMPEIDGQDFIEADDAEGGAHD